jgi:L-serine dehydratase
MHTILDFFKIGIGPSSSHTTGPINASRLFVTFLKQQKIFGELDSVKIELCGSLALTGKGHGTDVAIVLGLQNMLPEKITSKNIEDARNINKEIKLGGIRKIPFDKSSIIFNAKKTLKQHPNGIIFYAYKNDKEIAKRIYFSIGGGFVVTEENAKKDKFKTITKKVLYPFENATEMFTTTSNLNCKISELILENEVAYRKKRETKKKLKQIWNVMQDSVERGLTTTGTLVGSLKLERRASNMYTKFLETQEVGSSNFLEYASICAIAVNEENADMHKVVTAPTNGAAGIIPATMMYIDEYIDNKPKEWYIDFLLTAGAIAMLYKMNASISGAEVGCQGEVGVACSMAAGALTEIVGGNLKQIECAAEIAMEHNLGLTCDPIQGLVQIPCIERNAVGVGKAINASRIAMLEDKKSKISLDAVIKTMKKTGDDMKTAYKETSQGGLAVNVTEC